MPLLVSPAAPLAGPRACAGQGSVEFLLAAVPILLMGLGGIEAVHWYFVRQAVSLALLQAGRAAITQQADPVALDHAFAQALLPLYAAPAPQQAQARLQRAMQRRTHATLLPAWRIRLVSPSLAGFQDFASSAPELARSDALPVIDNDYLHEQHQRRMAQGWPQGRGPNSGQNTLQVNTLVLRLTWLHEPLLPGVRNLMRQLAPDDTRYGSLAMKRGGFVPVQREIALVMQSHAVAWQLPAHGRVTRLTGLHASATAELAAEDARADSGSALELPGGQAAVPGANALVTPDLPCVGLWCLRTSDPATPPAIPGNTAVPGATHSGGQAGGAPWPAPETAPPGAPPSNTAGDNESPGTPGNAHTGTENAQDSPNGDSSAVADTGIDVEDCPGCCEGV